MFRAWGNKSLGCMCTGKVVGTNDQALLVVCELHAHGDAAMLAQFTKTYSHTIVILAARHATHALHACCTGQATPRSLRS